MAAGAAADKACLEGKDFGNRRGCGAYIIVILAHESAQSLCNCRERRPGRQRGRQRDGRERRWRPAWW